MAAHDFTLFSAQVSNIHRGEFGYIANRVLEKVNPWKEMEIT